MNTSLRLPAAAACMLTLTGAAFAQNALGGGRALDGGLNANPGGRVNASTRDLQSIIRYNSSGNTLSGPGLGGRVSSSGTPYPGSLGDAISRGLVRDTSIIARYAPSQLRNDRGGTLSGPRIDRVAALESGNLPQGALTSPLILPQGTRVRDFARSGEPTVGYAHHPQSGNLFIVRGSALGSISVEPLPRVTDAYEALADTNRTGTAATYGRVIDELRRASLTRAVNPSRVEPAGSTPAAVPNPAAAPIATAAPSPVQYDPNATLKRLRERLAANKSAAPAPVDPNAPRRPDMPLTPDPSNAPATDALSEEDIAALRAMGLRLDTLVPPGATDTEASDAYTRLGQEALTAGRFGLADQMFQSALNRNRSNVLAAAGGIHATMGLGLLMTAGSDLRQHLAAHPEMIPVRYTESLLMPRPRADRLAAMLTADLEREGGALLPDAGLTLAYLGRQFDDATWLSKGLEAMAKQTKGDPQGTELHALLVRVWSTTGAPVPATGVESAPAP
ncbi:MAG TPA: hypothetical protein VEB22_13750, partial [Phycisphaerales bacterium]|nr:hypothetical protein [Phycisphaerales bacterium]